MISFGGFNFHLYGLILGLAILSALQVSLKFAREKGVEQKIVERAFWWALVGGVVGARIYHVVHLWGEIYSLDPLRSFYVWQGGLGIWGAIIGGLLGLMFFSLYTGTRNRILLDVMFIGLPLAQAVGRLGNWANGELYGKNGEPLFIWESALNLILFMILWKIGKQKKVSGKIVGTYLVGYGMIRVLLENFRPEDIIWTWQGVPVAIIMGCLSLIVGLFILKKKQS